LSKCPLPGLNPFGGKSFLTTDWLAVKWEIGGGVCANAFARKHLGILLKRGRLGGEPVDVEPFGTVGRSELKADFLRLNAECEVPKGDY